MGPKEKARSDRGLLNARSKKRFVEIRSKEESFVGTNLWEKQVGY